MQKGVFNQVAQFVEMLIVRALIFAIFPRGNHGFHSLALCLLNDRCAVITFVCNQVGCNQTFDQGASLRTISAGTFCNKDSERHTMRIHGQMYLAVEPPFVRLIP